MRYLPSFQYKAQIAYALILSFFIRKEIEKIRNLFPKLFEHDIFIISLIVNISTLSILTSCIESQKYNTSYCYSFRHATVFSF